MLKEVLAAVAKYRNTYTHSNPGVRDTLRWIFTRKAPPRPKPCPLFPNDPAALRANRSRPSITWIGHSTFLIQVDGVNLLTDPIFADRASPFPFAGPKRVTPVGLKPEDFPVIDVVLVSHDHYDHLNAASLRAVVDRQPENPPLFVVPTGLGKWFRKRGFARVAELDWWETLDLPQLGESGGLRIHGVPTQHWSQRIPWLINGARWNGFVVEGRGGRLLFPGDTGYSRDFLDIRERLGKIDIALLPIGAYDPEWFMKPMHTNPEEAVRIHADLGATLSIAMHWGTYPLTDEPFEEPPIRLRAAQKAAGVPEADFWVMGHGETRDLDHVWKSEMPGDASLNPNHIDEDMGA